MKCVAQMTFLAHETLHMSSLDPTNGMLCLGCAQDPLGGRSDTKKKMSDFRRFGNSELGCVK